MCTVCTHTAACAGRAVIALHSHATAMYGIHKGHANIDPIRCPGLPWAGLVVFPCTRGYQPVAALRVICCKCVRSSPLHVYADDATWYPAQSLCNSSQLPALPPWTRSHAPLLTILQPQFRLSLPRPASPRSAPLPRRTLQEANRFRLCRQPQPLPTSSPVQLTRRPRPARPPPRLATHTHTHILPLLSRGGGALESPPCWCCSGPFFAERL